jgi:ABC-type glutathione transport system ATPase component
MDQVDNVIRQLRLESCANSKVGGSWQRGISGGERKRTSIGIGLLINPSVLFMDEPTSGTLTVSFLLLVSNLTWVCHCFSFLFSFVRWLFAVRFG